LSTVHNETISWPFKTQVLAIHKNRLNPLKTMTTTDEDITRHLEDDSIESILGNGVMQSFDFSLVLF